MIAVAADPPETHYTVLGLHPRASREQVEKAYRFHLSMYEEGALATYSLLGSDEAEAARARIFAAYEVLGDPARRREYDVGLGTASPSAPLLPFPVAAPLPPAEPDTVPALAVRTPEEVLAASLSGPRPESFPDPLTGAALKRLREARGIALHEIALVSKIGVRYLEYIEEDRHSMLPAPVYLRGFLMEYGKRIGLDPKRTAEAYMARVPRKA